MTRARLGKFTLQTCDHNSKETWSSDIPVIFPICPCSTHLIVGKRKIGGKNIISAYSRGKHFGHNVIILSLV